MAIVPGPKPQGVFRRTQVIPAIVSSRPGRSFRRPDTPAPRPGRDRPIRHATEPVAAFPENLTHARKVVARARRLAALAQAERPAPRVVAWLIERRHEGTHGRSNALLERVPALS